MDFFDIFGAIGGALDSVGSAIVNFLNSALPILQNAIAKIASVLGNFISWVWDAISKIVGWITSFVGWLRTHIIDPIIDRIKQIKDKLDPFLKNLKKWLDQMRQNYLQWWDTYIKPIMDMIQRMRQILLVFRLMHLKWAQEADAYLAGIEAKIAGTTLAIWQNLNIIASWINLLLDPFGNIQGAVLLGSISPIAGAVWGAIWDARSDPITSAPTEAASIPGGYYDKAQVDARASLYAGGSVPPEIKTIQQAIKAEFVSMGYVV